MTDAAGGFIWYELMTTDSEEAAAFYGDVVGWSITDAPASDTGGHDYRFLMRKDGGGTGGMLTLTEAMRAGGARPGWFGYLHVADVDAALPAIQADGGTVLMPPTTIDAGTFALIADPQGVPVYVMTPRPPAGDSEARSRAFDGMAVQHVSWNELYTPDVTGAQAFYGKHFGFACNDKMPMGDMGDYWFVEHGGQQIGAMMRKPEQAPAMWQYYIRVADIDVAIGKVRARGGQVLLGPMEVPGGDWIINGLDPQGAPFSLVGSKGA